LRAQALPHLLPHSAGVDQLHLALAVLRLAVGDDPDVGADARVVEHVSGEADDRLQQVILDHVPANLALAAPRAASEQGRPVEHDTEPTATILCWPHLR